MSIFFILILQITFYKPRYLFLQYQSTTQQTHKTPTQI